MATQTVVGNLGSIETGVERPILRINSGATKEMFNDCILRNYNVVRDQLNLFSYLNVVNGEVDIMSLGKISKGLWQSRLDCDWRVKGKISLSKGASIKLCDIELMLEECFDEFKKCLDFCAGGTRDLLSTPEGQALFQALIQRIYVGQGNDLYDMVFFNNHPIIQSSNDNGWWDQTTQTAGEWANWVDQQFSGECDGIMTQLDDLKAEGHAHLNVELGAYDPTSCEYKGDIKALLKNLLKSSDKKVRMQRRGGNGGGICFLLHPDLFEAYRDCILEECKCIPETYQLMLTGSNSYIQPDEGLVFQGYPVICMDEWKDFDDATGVKNPRAILTAKGNFLLASCVSRGDLATDSGLTIQTSSDIREKGKTFIYNKMRIGQGIASHKSLAMASDVYYPS